jgi:hypothetical protein
MRTDSSLHTSARRVMVPFGSSSEPALDADHCSAVHARTNRGDHAADVAPVDGTVRPQRQDVAGEHVEPAQPAPALGPDRALAVVGDGAGHLVDVHVTALALGPLRLGARAGAGFVGAWE